MNQVLLLLTPPPRGGHGERGGGLYPNDSARQNEVPALLCHKNDKLFRLGMVGQASEFQTPFLNFQSLFIRVSGTDYSSIFSCSLGETWGHLHYLRVSPAPVS